VVDLRIDAASTRAALAELGLRIRPPATRICHWSAYMRPGLFAVYRRMLDPAEPRFPEELRSALLAAESAWHPVPSRRLRPGLAGLPLPRFTELGGADGANPSPARASSGL
jgi:hypothetical protein